MHVPSSPRLQSVADDIRARGWSVQPGFLDSETVAGLRERALEWWTDGAFRPAGVGRGESLRLAPEIRSDYVRWLDLETGGRFHDVGVAFYEPLRLALNGALYLGLFDLEAHVTMYPPGSAYARHLDRFRDASHRTVSVILYLNDGWTEADDGCLRLYLPPEQPGEPERVLDVMPEGGTLVSFLSGEIWHEVRPTRRDRMSLTGWFCTRR